MYSVICIKLGNMATLIILCTLVIGTLSNNIPKFDSSGREELLPWIREYNRNVTKPRLGIDQMHLNVKTNLSEKFDVYQQYDECHGCKVQRRADVTPGTVRTIILLTKFGQRIEIRNSLGPICRDHGYLREHGDYWLYVTTHGNNYRCRFILSNDPPNENLHVLWAFLALSGMALAWIGLTHLYRRGALERLKFWNRKRGELDFEKTTSTMTLELGSSVASVDKGAPQAESSDKSSPRKRLVSLDTFRGFSMASIIFLNYGGGGYWYFQHAAWDGLTPADLFFPWFMFMLGTSIVFGFRGMFRRGHSKLYIFFRIVKRAATLFILGGALGGWYDMDGNVRIPGVLQMLGVTYLLVASIHLIFVKNPTQDSKQEKTARWYQDITDYWPEWIIMLGFVATYLGLTFGLHVPGCPRGYLGPGGNHDGGRYFNCTAGANGYIDRLVLTERYIFRWSDIKRLYGTRQSQDPEGILGHLGSSFLCFLGLQAGKIIMYHKGHKGRIIRWVIWGIVNIGLGLLLCQARQTGGWIPINKAMWSLSFITLLAGLGFLMLTAAYLLVDVADVWNGAPFVYAGMNPLIVYVCHSLFNTRFPVRWKMPDRHGPQLFMALWGSGILLLLAYVMHRKRIYVTA